MRKLLLTSGFNFERYRITEYYGFVSGECAIGTGFLSELSLSVSDIFGTIVRPFKINCMKPDQ
ncbi:MAG: YbjQ family protein [Lachnospiraceae bacterium]|nr:YbjQ family protein [Lachnospiraceae bacterium]